MKKKSDLKFHAFLLKVHSFFVNAFNGKKDRDKEGEREREK
jgi:hypothetical protein